MNRTIGTLFMALALLAGPCFAQDKEYDLVIYGGSSAGVTAAVQAKRMGHTAVIVCSDKHLGGLSSGGLGATDSGDRGVIGGISREFYHRIWLHYQKPESWKWMKSPDRSMGAQGGRGFHDDDQTAWVFAPSAAEGVFEDFVRENDIPVFRGLYLDRKNGVKKEGTNIVSLTMKSGETFRGKMFLDATYEGDLLAAAGVSYTVGRESNAQYDETLNGIQTAGAVSHQFLGVVDPYVEKGNPASGLLPFVNPDAGGKDGEADKKVQAYCYRMCLTNVPENALPFTKPDHYKDVDYELFFRSIEARQGRFLIMSTMPDRKTDCNNYSAVSTDFIGANYHYPEASDEERLEIEKAHRDWQQGLLWTLQNHPRVPETLRKRYAGWGLAKDESTDTGHWGHKIYVREGRRMVSDFVHTENHCRRLIPVERPVGFGSYQMDSHNCQRHVAVLPDGTLTVRNEGDIQISPGGAYPIDFGSIVPKKSECTNLVVPVCVSSSHIAYGSIRMEPVFMVLAQSAATAACMAIDGKTAVQDVPYDRLAEKLKADKQVIEYRLNPPRYPKLDPPRYPKKLKELPGIVRDDSSADTVKTGQWRKSSSCSRFVEDGYLTVDELKAPKSVRYTLPIAEAGTYEVRVSYSPLPNRATNTLVEIHTADGVKSFRIDQRKEPNGDDIFHSLGRFPFAAGSATVEIKSDGADGYVVADAVQLLKK